MATNLASLGFDIDSSPMRRASGELSRLGRESGRAEKSATGLTSAYRALGSALAAVGATQFVREMVRVNAESQKLQASLRTVTGSAESASAAWDELEQFARTTPFALTQSIQAFTKMKALGLDPTIAALTSFGNTASAMGKDLNQMIEAVADAATGEFERLKEFGIRAKQQGDEVSFIFQGVETTVAKNAASITEYLQGIGEVQFAGAMSEQMDTLGGQLSNLEDSMDSFFRALGGAGGNQVASSAIESVSVAINALSDNAETLIDIASVLAIAVGSRLASGVTTAAAAMVSGQLQSARYQAALASMAGVSRGAAASQLALASATRAASGAMAFLGGPVGVALIAAGSLYYFRDSLFDTSQEASEAEKNVRALTERMDGLTKAELKHREVDLTRDMHETAIAIADARAEVEKLKREQSESSAGSAGIVNVGDIGGEGGLNALTEANLRVARLVGTQEALEEALARNKELMAGMADETDNAGDASERAAAAASKQADALAKLRERADPAFAEFNRYADEIDAIEAFNISAQEKEMLREDARREHNERMAEIAREGVESREDIEEGYWQRWMESAEENLTNFNQLSKTVIDSFSQGFGDAFEAVILDTKNAEDALKEMAASMIRSVVNAIGQMIAQWLALQAVQIALGTTATAATVGQASTAATAWAPAAALASLATNGANAAPASAALLSTTALSETLSLASFDGGGFTGTGSRSGGLDGKGGFMAMMHPQETVIDHTKGQGMGGDMTVIINNAPEGSRVEQRTDSRGNQIAEVFIADVSSGGPMSKAMQGTFGLRRQGR